MECPKCDGKTKVTDSGKYIGSVFRQRKCTECGHRFWTEENVSEDVMTVRSFLANKKYEYRERKKRHDKS